MMEKIEITKADNGYIVTWRPFLGYTQHVFQSLDDVFAWLLMHYERRSTHFHGSAYGRVEIVREEPSE